LQVILSLTVGSEEIIKSLFSMLVMLRLRRVVTYIVSYVSL
jgi:hypothetical protein